MAPRSRARDPDSAALRERIAALEAENGELKEKLEQLPAMVEERNFFQLERDRIYNLYEIAQRRLDESESHVRNKDREIEELLEKHQVAIKTYQHKIKDLLYGHRQDAVQLRIETEQSLKNEQDEHRERERQIRADRRKLKLQLREQEMAHEEAVRQLQADQERTLSAVRQNHERQLREVTMNFEERTRQLTEELELLRKTEVHELEERKNAHVADLLKQHETAYSDMKTYYNGVTTNNLDLIRGLKSELAEMKRKAAVSEQLMFEIAQENRRLSEPLQSALKEVEALRREVATNQKNRDSLTHAEANVARLETQLKARTWDLEVLRQKFVAVEKERDELYVRFETAVEDAEQRNVLREQLLERRLLTVGEVLEKKDALISEVVAASGVDAGQINTKLDDVLATKNAAIRNLRFELGRVSKLYNDALATFTDKLAEFGGDDPTAFGFRPLEIAE